jgi:hypothetical protein
MDCVVSQLISLRFIRFHVRDFQRGRERGRVIFVLLLISPRRLVPIEFCNRILRDHRIPWQIVRGQDRLHVTRLVAGDRINLDLVAPVCVPKTLSVLIGGGNHLTSAHNDRAAMLCP